MPQLWQLTHGIASGQAPEAILYLFVSIALKAMGQSTLLIERIGRRMRLLGCGLPHLSAKIFRRSENDNLSFLGKKLGSRFWVPATDLGCPIPRLAAAPPAPQAPPELRNLETLNLARATSETSARFCTSIM